MRRRITHPSVMLLVMFCANVTSQMSKEQDWRCQGSSKCIPISVCRRNYKRTEDDRLYETMKLLHCGFDKLNLLVCCSPPDTSSTNDDRKSGNIAFTRHATSTYTESDLRITRASRDYDLTSNKVGLRLINLEPIVAGTQRNDSLRATRTVANSTKFTQENSTDTSRKPQDLVFPDREHLTTFPPAVISTRRPPYKEPAHPAQSSHRPISGQQASNTNLNHHQSGQTQSLSNTSHFESSMNHTKTTTVSYWSLNRPSRRPTTVSSHPTANTQHPVTTRTSSSNLHGTTPQSQNPSATSTQDLTLHPNFSLLPETECGTIGIIPDRIINGKNASLGQFPWMALLGHREYHSSQSFQPLCGGTLISWKYVLTAAHCFKSPLLTIVRLGEHTLSTTTDCDQDGWCADPTYDIEIAAKIPHPQYGKPIQKNDIGLVRLRAGRQARFSTFIRPICLPFDTKDIPPGKHLITAGWGTSTRDAPAANLSTDTLLMATLPVVSNDECTAAQEDARLKPIIAAQMCTGVGAGSTSACFGDSGGPLMDVQERKGRYEPVVVQVGIVSGGTHDCGLNGSPTIYTRVTSYMGWVLDTIRS